MGDILDRLREVEELVLSAPFLILLGIVLFFSIVGFVNDRRHHQ